MSDPYKHFRILDVDHVKELVDLLCVIHRDGGQYIEKHGLKRSIMDAEKKYLKLVHAEDEKNTTRKDIKSDDSLRMHYEKVGMK